MKFSAPLISALSMISVVAGADIRVYSANNCSGAYLQCGNIATSTCCSYPSGVFASASLVGATGALTVWGFPGCSGVSFNSALNTCARPSFAFLSTRWHTTAVSKQAEASGAEECVEPDSVGFTGEDGIEHLVKVPKGRAAEVAKAVEENDIAKLASLEGI